MKILKNIKVIFVCFLSTFVVFTDVFANVVLHPSVLASEGYKQVTYVGGENNINTLGEKDEVIVSKTIEETDIENYFDITLKVKTSEKVTEILKDQDLAIVVVMDVSYTMADKDVTSSNGTISRLLAAQNAAKDFIDDFVSYSKDVEAVRQLGFVAFNTDAHEIFKLQDCNTTAIGTSLKNEMYNDTQAIFNTSGYNISVDRFTNIEAGLKRASDMLEATDINNKYIIFISDGLPTTYIEDGYNGYNPYMSTTYNPNFKVLNAKDTVNYGYTESSEGIFFNELANLLSTSGTSYSDEAARRAATMAKSIENKGTNIFSIGISIDTGVTGRLDTSSFVTDVDKEKYIANGNMFEVGNSVDGYKEWLKNDIGSGYYYDVTSTTALSNAYKQIFEKVKEYSIQSSQATWVVEDPMGIGSAASNIQFVGLYDDTNLDTNLQEKLKNGEINQTDTASFISSKISWDLKNSECITIEGDNNTTYYQYEIKYRVRLQNETDFNKDNIYNTNGITRLTYVVRTDDGVMSDYKYIDFPIPSVVGYLGTFSFTKQSAFNNTNLEGAKFKLKHSDDCECLDERVHVDENLYYEAVSLENGLVTFQNIPSGHDYVLSEIESPDNYILTTEKYDIKISYGVVSGLPNNLVITNDIKTTDLEISKTVLGNTSYKGKFDFNIEIFYDNEKLTGLYDCSYFVNNKETKTTIDLTNGNIKLGNQEKIIIYNLPVNSTYTINEIATEGYKVSYKLNNLDEQFGTNVTCNMENVCSLYESGNNIVQFINTTDYVLPETGSSMMLLIYAVEAVILGSSMFYLCYIIYKKRRVL